VVRAGGISSLSCFEGGEGRPNFLWWGVGSLRDSVSLSELSPLLKRPFSVIAFLNGGEVRVQEVWHAEYMCNAAVFFDSCESQSDCASLRV